MTALITGASSGIGAAFATQLAATGYDLVLVARRAERLQASAEDLSAKYGVAVTPLPADLATDDGITTVVDAISTRGDIGLLVNNAGFGTDGPYTDIDIGPQLAMLALHAEATMHTCRAALPHMKARGAGAVINVSSTAAWYPSNHNATYVATKAFLNGFSRALAIEMQGTGVKVQALCPGFTKTEFHDTEEYAGFDRGGLPGFMWMDAHEVVSASLAALERGPVIVIPGWQYKILAAVLRTPIGPAMARRGRAATLRR